MPVIPLNINIGFKDICFSLMFLLLTMIISPLKSQQVFVGDDSLRHITQAGFLNDIDVCTWKKGAPACVNISFDDNLSKWKQMSEILESFGFRATFFPIANTWNIYKDSLLIMSSKGHEMGSHSFSHPNLKELANDTSRIIFELAKSKEMIEDMFGKKCYIFAEPFHGRSDLSIKLVAAYYPFVRNNSFCPNVKEVLLPYANLTKEKLTSVIEESIKQGKFVRLYGHSIDGEGSGPITKDFFIESLKVLQHYVSTNNLWVTSLTEGSLYQKVSREIRLSKSILNDTLTIEIEQFEEDQYADFDEVPLSIKIPKYFCEDIEVLFDSVEVTENNQYKILTFDALTTRYLTVLLKNINSIQRNDSVFFDNRINIYPNPAVDYLNFYLNGNGVILSKRVYGFDGKTLLSDFDDSKSISLKSIDPGFYVVEVHAIVDSSECKTRRIILIK
jgi:hypothetical protein